MKRDVANTPTKKARRIRYAAILTYIAKFHSKNGAPPTISELAKAFGTTNRSTADKWLNYMDKHELIEKTIPGAPRAYKITDRGTRYMNAYRVADLDWKVGETIDVK